MALKRESLKAMGLNEEQIQAAIDMHLETTTKLQEQIKSLQEQLSAATEKATQYDEAKKQLDELGKEDWKTKYEKEHADFDAFKADVEKKAVISAKTDAYTALLKKLNISEKRIPAILKVTNLDDIELDKNGSVKNADKVEEQAKAEWGDFIVTTEKQGANTPTPPSNNGGNTFEQMSLAEKMQYANEHPTDQSVKDWLNKK